MPESDLGSLSLDRSAAPVRRRRRRWLGWLLAGLAVLAAALAWFLVPRPAVVQTTPIVTSYPSQQYVVLNATGFVVAQRKAAVASKGTGRLEWLGVTEGSRVKEGEVIARLDDRDVVAQADSADANTRAARAALEQALAEERDATQQLARNRDLAAKGFVSAATVDVSVARKDRASAAVSSARANISASEANARNARIAVDYTLIRAPFDGVILSKTANVGDIITPFSSATESKGAVVTMADMGSLEVEADVSEASLGKIQPGQPAEILLDAVPDLRFRGRVSRIVPTVDRAKATVLTKVRFEAIDPRVLPEMSAKVAFLSRELGADDQRPVVAVHPDALAQRDGRSVLFVVREGRAVEVPVQTGARLNELVAISGAIKTGERAVIKPAAGLADQASVAIAAK